MRVRNGLRITLLLIIAFMLMITVMQFPAAGSEHPIEVTDAQGVSFTIFYPPERTAEDGVPHWAWDSTGKVFDVTGQYITMSDEEACNYYGICKRVLRNTVSTSSSSTDGGTGDANDGGGC